MMDPLQIQFQNWLARYNWTTMTEKQKFQFETYYQLLVQWNKQINLTNITERTLVYEKHFYDSLTIAFHIPMQNIRKMVDIGSGAGFPSIPLVIMFPNIKLTIIDSLMKRMVFLQQLIQQLSLTTVTCIHGRAEQIAHQPMHRDQYDLVTARAVAKLNKLSELCLPFVKPKGIFVAMKGANVEQEVEMGKPSLELLQAQLTANYVCQLPIEKSKRHLVVITKMAPTPKKYPRKTAEWLKKPLA